MADMNPSIILAGQPVNALNALSGGIQAASMANDTRHTSNYRNALQQYGAGAIGGDQGSINALAAYDPGAALGIQQTRQQMDILDAQERRTAAKYAASLSAARRSAAAQEIEDAVKMGLGLPDEATWDTFMGENQPDLVGQFGNRQALANRYMTFADILKNSREPDPIVINGQLVNPRTSEILGDYRDAPEPPKPQSSPGKVQADIAAGFLPEGTPLRGEGVTVNNTMGGSEGEKFYETLDKAQGDMFAGLLQEGVNIPTRMAQIDQMEAILGNENTPEGLEAALKTVAGNFGINTEGLSDLQAAQAIINQLVPGQRAPGSGTMSDADLALFKASLPRLINTREGNLQIMRTMRGIASYQAAQAQIAAAVANREISPADARRALSELENPLQIYRRAGATTVGGQGFSTDVQSLIDRYAD
ncbi:hypothetical protein [Oceanicola sp. S124]|uniref:hypothetical protein n=1 Tax=Oceanicola sp. S124 TaxID=1042378 RepID=UPI0002559006|nr:hypothetical protein [Oceanicola sp. S124]